MINSAFNNTVVMGLPKKPLPRSNAQPKFGCAQFVHMVSKPYKGEDQFIQQCLVKGTDALQQQSKENADGWGIAAYTAPGDVFIWKSKTKAEFDPAFKTTAKRAAQLKPLVALGHVRKGSPVDVANNHPFPIGKAIFMHNGIIPTVLEQELKEKLAKFPLNYHLPPLKGTTDTEIFARYLQGEMIRKFHTGNPSQIATEPLVRFFNHEVSQLASASDAMTHQDPSEPGFNFTLVDDKRIIASRHGRPLHWGVRMDKRGGHRQDVIVATNPMQLRKGTPIQWSEIPSDQLVVIEREQDTAGKPDIKIAFQKLNVKPPLD